MVQILSFWGRLGIEHKEMLYFNTYGWSEYVQVDLQKEVTLLTYDCPTTLGGFFFSEYLLFLSLLSFTLKVNFLLDPTVNSQIFWFGDLNYRISMLDSDMRKLVALRRWDELLSNDQVRFFMFDFAQI